MLRKTVIVVDYDSNESSRILNALVGLNDVLLMAFNRLPDIPIRINRVKAIIILCTKPDDDVLQSVKTLRLCYNDLKIVVISPEPSPEMVTQTVLTGANEYINLSSDEFRMPACLQTHNHVQKKPFSFVSNITLTINRIIAWLHPKRLSNAPTISQKFPLAAPLNAVMPDNWIHQVLIETPTPQYKNQIEVQFFGDFRVKINGQDFRPKNNAVLLAYLLYNHSRPIHKEILMTKFWGENVNDAKNCLNAAIFSLRKSLSEMTSEKTIIFQNDFYAFNTAVWHIETDTDTFTKHWEKSRALLRTQGLESAVAELNSLKAIYRDDFTPNINNDWAVGRRDEFREKYLQALNLLSEYFWNVKKLSDCIDSCLDILQVDDCFEPTHRRLMECYLLLKMKDKAIRQYKKCGESLRKLNISPELETENLYLSIIKV